MSVCVCVCVCVCEYVSIITFYPEYYDERWGDSDRKWAGSERAGDCACAFCLKTRCINQWF